MARSRVFRGRQHLLEGEPQASPRGNRWGATLRDDSRPGQGTFSLGPNADKLIALGLPVDEVRDLLIPLLDAVTKAERLHDVPDDPSHLIEPLLQSLLGCESGGQATTLPPGERFAYLDASLNALRTWADCLFCEILPSRWVFSNPQTLEELGEPSLAGMAFEFSSRPQGTVRLERFGVLCPGGVLQWRGAISVGRIPSGLEELRRGLVRLAQTGNCAREAEELLKSMEGWAQCAYDGKIKDALADFFACFWRLLGREFRRTNHQQFDELRSSLDGLLSEFGLAAFYPTRVQDWDESWLTVRKSVELCTGRVYNVIRAGLREGERLWFKADVEAE